MGLVAAGVFAMDGVEEGHVFSALDGHNVVGVVVDHAGYGVEGFAVLAQDVAHATVGLLALVDLDVDGLDCALDGKCVMAAIGAIPHQIAAIFAHPQHPFCVITRYVAMVPLLVVEWYHSIDWFSDSA